MLAHLLRSILFAMFAVGCACLWYFRAEAWWLAWAGFWFPPVALASVLALEFALAAVVNRADPAPRAWAPFNSMTNRLPLNPDFHF
jgi:hypothetical protein